MNQSKVSLSKAYQVALMKEEFFDTHMPQLRVRKVRGLHLVTFDVLRNLEREGKLKELPEGLRLEALREKIYPTLGVRRVLDETLIPEIREALIGELLEPHVHTILTDAVELYGIFASITLRLKLLSDKSRSTTQSAALIKIRTSQEEDILAVLMLAKLATGNVKVNLYHRLRAFRRSMQSLEDILSMARQNERDAKKRADLQRLTAGRLPSRSRY